jgi:hypothetical protein
MGGTRPEGKVDPLGTWISATPHEVHSDLVTDPVAFVVGSHLGVLPRPRPIARSLRTPIGGSRPMAGHFIVLSGSLLRGLLLLEL